MAMEHPAFGPASGVLLDLFQSTDAGVSERRETRIAVASELGQGIASRSAAAGWRPDTLHLAAWVWLQQRWLGTERDAALGCAAWIAQVDAARQADPRFDAAAGWMGSGEAGDAQRLFVGSDTQGLRLVAPAERIDDACAMRVLTTLMATMAALLASPHAALASIQAVAPADRERMLHAWNRPASPCERLSTVHGIFAQRAAEFGSRTAVAGGEAPIR